MSMTPTGPGTQPGPLVPRGGSFAVSEVLPLIAAASHQLNTLREERHAARERAAEAKANARRIRANLIVNLRVWGIEVEGIPPIKTSAERNEWADADANVQQAELEADLAQAAAINAGDALDDAQSYFETLRSMLAIERDDLNTERGAPR